MLSHLNVGGEEGILARIFFKVKQKAGLFEVKVTEVPKSTRIEVAYEG